MKVENEDYGPSPLDFMDEDDSIDKIIMFQVNDILTDIFIETRKTAYIDNEVKDPLIPKGLIALFVIHFCHISDGRGTPFEDLELAYEENINYVRREYTVKISEHVNNHIRETVEKDLEIVVTVIPKEKDEIMRAHLDNT